MKTVIQNRPAWSDVLSVLSWLIIVFITWSFMHAADHFLLLTPEALGKYFSLRWVLLLHITAGGGALILGPLQFWKALRKYGWRLHRVLGMLYLLAIVCSSLCAVVLAATTAYEVGWAYAFSLQVWVSVWITATFIAWWAAVKRRFTLHAEWMVRSYIVTIAFVISGLSLRMPIVQDLGNLADISPSLFWLGWAVPLFIYDAILALKRQH